MPVITLDDDTEVIQVGNILTIELLPRRQDRNGAAVKITHLPQYEIKRMSKLDSRLRERERD